MKKRRIPPTDLARIAPLHAKEKWVQLRRLKAGYGGFSYDPFRACLSDIFRVLPPLFAFGGTSPIDTPSIEWIEKRLRETCADNVEYGHNLGVARALLEQMKRQKFVGRSIQTTPISLGVGGRVEYWLPIALSHEGRPLIPFMDLRRPGRWLTVLGRRFVFSVMHEHLRVNDPDLFDCQLGIFQFDCSDDSGREVRLAVDEGVELYTFDQLSAMVQETYEIWEKVLAEREDEDRRDAYRRTGTLL